MKMSFVTEKERGLTLIELLVVIAAVGLFAMLIYSNTASQRVKDRALRVQCVSNLRQTGLAFRIWEGDHGDRYPMAISETNGGAMEFTSGLNAFRVFQVMSNQLGTPRILFCPCESDKARFSATNFNYLSNSNLSYFVGLDADEAYPQGFLMGDRNITNGTPLKDGVLELTAGHPAGWTDEFHNKVGDVVLADGSSQELSSTGLRNAANAPVFTNRLLMPVLGP